MGIAESREGIVLYDYLHVILPPPIDLSPWIFGATYIGAILSILVALKAGFRQISLLLIGHGTVILLRSLTILWVPLDPPSGMIPLIDSFVVFCTPDSFVATRDLFFSGHCGSLFFYYLIAQPKWLKYSLLLMNIFIAIALSWQRVHYTIDIIVALVVAWLVAKMYITLFNKYYPKETPAT